MYVSLYFTVFLDITVSVFVFILIHFRFRFNVSLFLILESLSVILGSILYYYHHPSRHSSHQDVFQYTRNHSHGSICNNPML